LNVGFELLEPRQLLAVDLISTVEPSLVPETGSDVSQNTSVSADGRYVAFESAAGNLVPGDTNGRTDVFVRDTQTGAITRVSTDSSDSEGNDGSFRPSISANGRYVAFESTASNLVLNDTNGVSDVFVKDTQTGTVTRVSTDNLGGEGNGSSDGPHISADGLHVTFRSSASNLVSSDTNGNADVFVKDTQTGTVTLVSTDSSGNQGDSSSHEPKISADARYVAFKSFATNLVTDDTNWKSDIFVKDTQTGTITRVSTDSSGAEGNDESNYPSISADGRYVVFESRASNLVLNDTNGNSDIFVKDTQTGVTARVSTDSSGNQGNYSAQYPNISADGRYVAFGSYAANLVSGDANSSFDVFVKDTQTGATTLASIDSSGTQGNSGSTTPSISSDGRYVAFQTAANNFVPGDTNGQLDVFLKDMQSGTLQAASTRDASILHMAGNGDSGYAALSSTGRYVAFESDASNLVTGDTNNARDIFVKDTQTDEIVRVSTTSAGGEAGTGSSYEPSLSADGRYVGFHSYARYLVSSDTNGRPDVFFKDTQTDAITRVSTDSSGNQGNGTSTSSSLSADGRYVAFDSTSSNLVSGDTNGKSDVFVKDTLTGATTRLSTDSSGNQSNGYSYDPSLSADGRYVAFESDASNLVSGDTNNYQDVFVKDTQTGVITRVSTNSAGSQADLHSHDPSISADGRYVAFHSYARNLVADDTNYQYDVFVKDTQTGAITRVSTDSSGNQSNNQSYAATVSADGRYVAFHSAASNLVPGDTNGCDDVFVKDTQTGAITRISTDSLGSQGNNVSTAASISADGLFVAFQSEADNLHPDDTSTITDVFRVYIGPSFDYGDAPDSYLTLDASGGPSHWIDANLFLGANPPDMDIDGFSDGTDDLGNATDDDTEGSVPDDEDGVTTFALLTTFDTTYSITVALSNTTGGDANLVGWIDFDGSGTFEADEAATAVVAHNGTSAVLNWNHIGTTGPDISGGNTFARFRLTSDAITATDVGGAASDGEVEDYQLEIVITGSIHGLKFLDVDGDGIYEPGTDQPLEGVEFVLSGTDNLGSDVNLTDITDANGHFEFTGLLPSVAGVGSGTGYTVTETVPAEFVATSDPFTTDLWSGQELVAEAAPLVWTPLTGVLLAGGAAHDPGQVSNPKMVELSNGNFVVAWEESGDLDGAGDGVFFQVFGPAGSPVTPAGVAPYLDDINPLGTGDQESPEVAAVAGGGFAITWQSEGGPTDVDIDTDLRIYDNSGAPVTGTIAVHDTEPTGFDDDQVPRLILGLASGNVAVVFEDENTNDGTNTDDYFVRTFQADGTPLTGMLLVGGAAHDPGQVSNPRMAELSNGNFVVAWEESDALDGADDGVFFQVFGPDGAPVTPAGVAPYLDDINPLGTGDQESPEVAAVAGGGFAITWQSEGGPTDVDIDTDMRIYDNSGAPVTGTIAVHDTEPTGFDDDQVPRLITGLASGNVAVVFEDENTNDGTNTDDYFVRTFGMGHPFLQPGQEEVVLGQDLMFGNAVPGSIHGLKFEDVDGDGIYTPATDQPLANVEFTLTGTDGLGNNVNLTDTTDGNGHFEFTGLLPSVAGAGAGTGYTVTETLPAGHVATTPTVFSSDLASGEELVAFYGQAMIPSPYVEVQEVRASDEAANSAFGYAVDVDGDVAVVGAFGQASDQGAAYVYELQAGTWTAVAKLTASDGATGDYFGYSIGISGDTIVIGAPHDNEYGDGSGSAYVFVRPDTGWTTTDAYDAKLTASDGAAWDSFGSAVSVSGDTVAIGAHGDDVNGFYSGSAYVYVRPGTGWTTTSSFTAKLTASDGAARDFFGGAVSIDGDALVVGAGGFDDTPGAAYVYVRPGTGWATTADFDAKLTAADGAAGDHFGSALDISGDTVVVGAGDDDPYGARSGSAYVYVRPGTGWTTTDAFDAKLTAGDGEADDYFGYSVSISGDAAVIGAKYDDPHGDYSGSAYVFARPEEGWATTGSFTAKLTAGDGAEGDEFGSSVSISGDKLVIGARYDDGSIEDSGSAYVYALSDTIDPRVEVYVGPSLMFGNAVPGSIHGFKFEDMDGDGVYTPGTDQPLAGVDFTLTGTDGQGNQISLTDTSDAEGYFEFTDLVPSVDGAGAGTGYTVTETVPAGHVATTAASFARDLFSGQELVAFEGQADPLGPDQTQVLIGAPLMFGNTVPGSIHGFKFEDLDGDGVYTAGTDLPLAGVEFTLTGTDGQGNVMNQTDTTDANGYFEFTGLLPSVAGAGAGTGYAVTETMPGGFVATTAPSFSGNLSSGEELVAFGGQADPLGADQTQILIGTPLMFGNTVPGSIHGFKFEDVDGDGVYTPGTDQPLAGVEFTLTGTDGQGNEINLTDSSDSNGYFEFTGLAPSVAGAGPGTGYTVTETIPEGFVATTPTSLTYDLQSRQELVAWEGQAMIPPPYSELQKLLRSEGAAAYDYFGEALAVDGNVAVVGTWGDDSGGIAFVYESQGGSWNEVARLTASDGTAGDYFGYAVGVSGDTIVIGAFGDAGLRGSAYVFERPDTGWATTSSFAAKLTASDGSDDSFGRAVSISGDTIVVGAYGDDDRGFSSGSAYVYERPVTGWATTSSFAAKLTAGDGAAYDYFGESVSVRGDTVVVGASGDDDYGSYSGSAYVYVRPDAGWATTSTYSAKLTAGDGAAGDSFGRSLIISGDTVVIGALGDDDHGEASGSAYVYERPDTGWATTDSYTAKLTASDGAAGDNFGTSVSLSGETIVVGAMRTDDNGEDSGSAYVYERPDTGWATTDSYTAKLTASDGAAHENFGSSMSISGHTLLVGARYDDDNGPQAGSAYLFSTGADPRTEVLAGVDLKFGNTVPGSIHGFKFEDVDGDGVYDEAVDVPLADVEFTLTGTDGQGNEITQTDTTDASGYFEFTGLLPSVAGAGPGTGYTVTETVPEGHVATTPTEFTDDLLSRQEWVTFAGQALIPPPWTEQQKLVSSHGVEFEQFGMAVSVSEDTLVVGAPSADPYGAAYVYELQAGVWTEVARLTASAGAASDDFGWSVSISGDTIVIGAASGDATYVFERPSGGWYSKTEDAKLTASDGTENGFGYAAVSVSEDTIVIGARGADGAVPGTGAAYVYVRPAGGWVSKTEDAKLTASDGEYSDWFGVSVSVSGDAVVVGAFRDDDHGTDSGSAYVFVRPAGGWVSKTEDAKLTASDGAASDQFGFAVSVSGETVTVGADYRDYGRGAVYVYVRPVAGWESKTEDARLVASDGEDFDAFGWSVSVSQNTILVGAYGDDDLGNRSGAAYIYARPAAGWADTDRFDAKLTASDGAAGDEFGQSVSISGDTAVVGVYADSDSESRSAYVFSYVLDPREEVLINEDLMFGNTVPGSMHGFKFEDVDGDGSYDEAVDVPLAGVEFTLTGTDGQGHEITQTDTTDGDGYFEFTGLLPSVDGAGPGTGYTVTETVPDGSVATTATEFSSDLESGEQLVSEDLMFGNAVLGSIHGFKFEDVDGDGMYTTGTDQPLANVEFTLTGTDGQGSEITRTGTTDANGYFEFTGLLPSVAGAGPGTGYAVTETLPDGFAATTPTEFSSDLESREELVAFDGQADPLGTGQVQVLIGTPLMFGNTAPGSIHGFKFEDMDGDGVYTPGTDQPLAGVEFALAGTDGQGNDVNLTATTDESGYFEFTGLWPSVDGAGPGTGYTITETVPAGYVATTATSFSHDLLSGEELVAFAGQAEPLGAGQTELLIGPDLMFGNTVPGSIHGFKFEDVDGDGVYDEAVDMPLADVAFTLTGTDGQGNEITQTVITDASGYFDFTSLLPSVAGAGPGTGYTVTETVSTGHVATTATSFWHDLASGEELVAFEGQADPLGPGQTQVLIEAPLMFGNAVPGSIHGFKFEDVDGDGIYTPGTDQPLAGVEFTLTGTDGQGNDIDRTDTTDANGFFEFTGLWPSVADAGPGTGYTVTETLPAGFAPTTPTAFVSDLHSGEELVAFAGQAQIPPPVYVELDKVYSGDSAPDDRFGYSVAIDGNTAVVGADGQEAAYVYEFQNGTWTTAAKLTAADGELGDHFGWSVGISGQTIVIGAFGDEDHGRFSGAAYLYERPDTGWATTGDYAAKLTAGDGAYDDRFGGAVAVSGDTVVIGAYRDDDRGYNSGSAYVYQRPDTGWVTTSVYTAKLTAGDGAASDSFGQSVSVSDDTVVIGAYRDDDQGYNSGSAYVYERPDTGWATTGSFMAKLTADDGAAYDQFGWSLSVDGDTVVVGAYGDDDHGADSGAAYVYVRPDTGWASTGSFTAKLTDDDDAARDQFGSAVSVSDDTVVVGAVGDDDHGFDSGAAYVFLRPTAGWATTGSSTAKLTAGDAAAAGSFGRSVSVCGDSVVISALWGDGYGSEPGSAYFFSAERDPRTEVLVGQALMFGNVQMDFGDAPDPTYPTLLASDGARHIVRPGFHLGSLLDAESDGQPNGQALGDDTHGVGDEDGVRLLQRIVPGTTARLEVTATAAGFLNAWLDLNADGDWDDPGEQFAVDEPLVAGVNPLAMTVPATAVVTPTTFARFRFSTQSGLDYRGWAPDGEVEDYEVAIESAFADDIVGRNQYGYLWVAKSNGSNAFNSSIWGQWSTARTWTDVMVGDFNGDGHDDVVARNEFGNWWVAASNGSNGSPIPSGASGSRRGPGPP